MPNTQPSHRALLKDYLALPDQLGAAVNDLSHEQLDLTNGPDQWSIRQIVHHLADGQTMWVARIIEFTGEHFVEHLGEIETIKMQAGLSSSG